MQILHSLRPTNCALQSWLWPQNQVPEKRGNSFKKLEGILKKNHYIAWWSTAVNVKFSIPGFGLQIFNSRFPIPDFWFQVFNSWFPGFRLRVFNSGFLIRGFWLLVVSSGFFISGCFNSEFWILEFWFRVFNSGFSFPGCQFCVYDSRCLIPDFRVWNFNSIFLIPDFGIQIFVSGFWILKTPFSNSFWSSLCYCSIEKCARWRFDHVIKFDNVKSMVHALFNQIFFPLSAIWIFDLKNQTQGFWPDWTVCNVRLRSHLLTQDSVTALTADFLQICLSRSYSCEIFNVDNS